MKPRRIQRKRTKGWKMPENTVYVGRPHVFGNRWTIGCHSNFLGRRIETLTELVDVYRNVGAVDTNGFHAYVREILRGKNLACWCPLDQPCHADVLLEIANATPEPEAQP